MDKGEAIQMIDSHKNKLTHPVEMLRWTWLRVIIDNIDNESWNRAIFETIKTMEQ